MNSYISQAEASNFVESIASWSSAQAVAFLTAASRQAEQYCQRTFAATDLTPDVKMAIAFLADWLKNSNHVGGKIASERIGDYSITFQQSETPFPSVVTQLLQPYRVFVMG